MVNHSASLNVAPEAADLIDEEFVGSQVAFSHTCMDQLVISKIMAMTHDQLITGYVCKKARRINEIVIGTRFR